MGFDKILFAASFMTGHQTLNDGKSVQRVPCNISIGTTKLPLEKIFNSVNIY